MNNEQPSVFLDTHIWIWLINGDNRLENTSALDLINNAVKKSSVYISIISVWEIGMLEAKGRIKIQGSCLDWVKKALSIPGFRLVSLTPEIALESSNLPGVFNGDPADRMIVASALSLNSILITADKEIIEYGNRHLLKVSTVSRV